MISNSFVNFNIIIIKRGENMISFSDVRLWWYRYLPILKFRLIITGIIVFIAIPWLIGIVIYLTLLLKWIF